MESLKKVAFSSQHFSLYELADGVYGAVAKPGGSAYSNAGIIDLGESTLIYDTFDSAVAAEDLIKAASVFSPSPISAVIISHFHPDHWSGNQVFDPAIPIISTHESKVLMDEFTSAYMEEIEEQPDQVREWIREVKEEMETETDPRKLAGLESSLRRLYVELDALPGIKLRPPNQTYKEKMTFQGSKREVELIALERAHTDSDAYLNLSEERIVFLGDLGFFETQPFLAYSQPERWIQITEWMMDWDVDVFVPGHGPIGTKDDLAMQSDYIGVLEGICKSAVEGGKTVEEVVEGGIPGPFDAWLHGGMRRFEINVQRFFKLLTEDG